MIQFCFLASSPDHQRNDIPRWKKSALTLQFGVNIFVRNNRNKVNKGLQPCAVDECHTWGNIRINPIGKIYRKIEDGRQGLFNS